MTTCGVVLAAGGGRRFGSVKQLAPLDGRPLLQHAVDAALAAASLDRVVVVLGAAADDVAAAIEPGRAEVVVCDAWADGVAASLRAGLAAARGAEWTAVTLGDEPRLPPAAIDRVVGAARSAPAGTDAVRALWQGRPGHPVALSPALAARADELRGDAGARVLMGAANVVEVELGDLGPVADVDLPRDLR